jgi:hypothetical protein
MAEGVLAALTSVASVADATPLLVKDDGRNWHFAAVSSVGGSRQQHLHPLCPELLFLHPLRCPSL